MSEWQPIETLPDGQDAILYQPANEEHYRGEGMVIGSLEHWSARDGEHKLLFVHPANIGGWEMECEVSEPTHWMPLPKPPV